MRRKRLRTAPSVYAPEEIADRSVCLSEDIGGVLERLVS